MQPGTSREIPSGAKCPKPACLREETPGKEAKGVEGRTVMLKRRGGKEDTAEEVTAHYKEDGAAVNQIKTEEKEDAGKYEEELDPRIQVCGKTA